MERIRQKKVVVTEYPTKIFAHQVNAKVISSIFSKQEENCVAQSLPRLALAIHGPVNMLKFIIQQIVTLPKYGQTHRKIIVKYRK